MPLQAFKYWTIDSTVITAVVVLFSDTDGGGKGCFHQVFSINPRDCDSKFRPPVVCNHLLHAIMSAWHFWSLIIGSTVSSKVRPQLRDMLWFTCIYTHMLCLIHSSDTKRQERLARKAKQTDDTSAILCNSVKMIREKLTVSGGKW